MMFSPQHSFPVMCPPKRLHVCLQESWPCQGLIFQWSTFPAIQHQLYTRVSYLPIGQSHSSREKTYWAKYQTEGVSGGLSRYSMRPLGYSHSSPCWYFLYSTYVLYTGWKKVEKNPSSKHILIHRKHIILGTGLPVIFHLSWNNLERPLIDLSSR
jgi:hypothetical protein